jgi:hypothetical protein
MSLRSNQFIFTLCRKSKNKECKMSGNIAWVCICIQEGGHFSIPDADADANPGLTGLALTKLLGNNTWTSSQEVYGHSWSLSM